MGFLLIVLILSGCNGVPIQGAGSKEKQVDEYNSLVKETLNAYVKADSFAQMNNKDMLKYVTKDSDWGLLSGVKTPEKLSQLELKSFETYGTIYDKYFTSIGADSVREVVVINSANYNMFVTIIWSKDKIQSISRAVKEL